MSRYQFTDAMAEISGFGGSYEAACRRMVVAGVEWSDAHPDSNPRFKTYTNVTGLILEDNEDAEQLAAAMVEAAKSGPEGSSPTGAMVQYAVAHVFFIRQNGWDAYVRRKTEQKSTEPV